MKKREFDKLVEAKLARVAELNKRPTDLTRILQLALRREHEATVSFSVQGWVKQHVILTDLRITPASLQRGLNTGYYLTTIQEGGEIISRGGKVVGRVEGLSTKTDLEYFDFEVAE